MYKDFYQMTVEAFGNMPLLKIFYNSETHKNAWHYLLYGISNQEQFLLVTGDYGMGKTTLCLGLIRILKKKSDISHIYISTPNLDFSTIVSEIINHLKIEVSEDEKNNPISGIYRFFREKENLPPLYVLLDDAHELSLGTLSQIRALANFNYNGNFPFRIVFFAHTSFLDLLKTPQLKPLDQRIKRRVNLDHFSYEETKDYIYSRLVKSGAPGIPTFTEEALELIHTKSNGVPRLINNICDSSLLVGATKQAYEITSAIVREAIGEEYAEKTPQQDEHQPFSPSPPPQAPFQQAPAPYPQAQQPAAGPPPAYAAAYSPPRVKINSLDDAVTQNFKVKKRRRFIWSFIMAAAVIILICVLGYAVFYFWQKARLINYESKYQSKAEMVERNNEMVFKAVAFDPEGHKKESTTGLLYEPLKKDVKEYRILKKADTKFFLPYTLHLESYRSLDHARDALYRFFKMGLEPYIVRVDLKSKGVWYRIYHGHFSSRSAALNEVAKYGIKADVTRISYGNLVGSHLSRPDMDRMIKRLESFGYPYFTITDDTGKYALYSGVYESRADAEEYHKLLMRDGINSKIVRIN